MLIHRSSNPCAESSDSPCCFSQCLEMHQAADAAIAQLGERQTEDLKVPGSIPGLGIVRFFR